MSRAAQKFDDKEVIKRLNQCIARLMLYADQRKPAPPDAIAFVNITKQEIAKYGNR